MRGAGTPLVRVIMCPKEVSQGKDLRHDLRLYEPQLRRPTRSPKRQYGPAVRPWCTEMRGAGTPLVRVIMCPKEVSQGKDLRHDLRLYEPQLRRPTRSPKRQYGPAVRPWCTEMRGSGTPLVRSIMSPKRTVLAARSQVTQAPTAAAHPPDPATLRARPNVSTLPPSGRGVPK